MLYIIQTTFPAILLLWQNLGILSCFVRNKCRAGTLLGCLSTCCPAPPLALKSWVWGDTGGPSHNTCPHNLTPPTPHATHPPGPSGTTLCSHFHILSAVPDLQRSWALLMMNHDTDSMNFTDKPDLRGTLTRLPRSLGQRRGFADTHTRITRHIVSQGC